MINIVYILMNIIYTYVIIIQIIYIIIYMATYNDEYFSCIGYCK